MSTNPIDLLRREPVPALLLALSAGCAVVAAAAGRDVVTALIGALLVVVYWAIERLAARIGAGGTIQRAMVVGVVGMVVRLAIVVGGLVIVGSSIARASSTRSCRSSSCTPSTWACASGASRSCTPTQPPFDRLTHRHRSAR